MRIMMTIGYDDITSITNTTINKVREIKMRQRREMRQKGTQQSTTQKIRQRQKSTTIMPAAASKIKKYQFD